MNLQARLAGLRTDRVPLAQGELEVEIAELIHDHQILEAASQSAFVEWFCDRLSSRDEGHRDVDLTSDLLSFLHTSAEKLGWVWRDSGDQISIHIGSPVHMSIFLSSAGSVWHGRVSSLPHLLAGSVIEKVPQLRAILISNGLLEDTAPPWLWTVGWIVGSKGGFHGPIELKADERLASIAAALGHVAAAMAWEQSRDSSSWSARIGSWQLSFLLTEGVVRLSEPARLPGRGAKGSGQ